MLNSLKRLKKQPSLKATLFFILLGFLLLVTALVFVPWQQTVYGHGRVTTFLPSEREQNISAPMGGRLGKWFVSEGEHVKKGEPIVEILDLDPEVVSRLKEEKAAIESSIEALYIAIENSERNIKRHIKLEKKGASTKRIIEQAQLELVKYTQELAKQRVDLAKIKVAISRQDSRLVKSPVDGVIVDRTHGVGGVIVKETDILATIVPDSVSRIVELWVRNMDVPLIDKGDKVMLQFEGWPAVQFSGWPQVAIGSFEGRVIFISPQNNNLGEYKIFVEPISPESWPSSNILRLGTNTKAWVVLDNVSLGYELWRRYNGFPININDPDLMIQKK